MFILCFGSTTTTITACKRSNDGKTSRRATDNILPSTFGVSITIKGNLLLKDLEKSTILFTNSTEFSGISSYPTRLEYIRCRRLSSGLDAEIWSIWTYTEASFPAQRRSDVLPLPSSPTINMLRFDLKLIFCEILALTPSLPTYKSD